MLYIVIRNVKMEYTLILHETKSDFLCNLTKGNRPKEWSAGGPLGVCMGLPNRPIKLNPVGKFKKMTIGVIT